MGDNLWLRIACVAGAGAVGALCRWGASRGTNALFGNAWPYGTLLVNVVGCLLFGLFYEYLRPRLPVNSVWHLFLLTGFLGAFTTYSTFAFDTYELYLQTDRGWHYALLNVALHIFLGSLAVVIGVAVGRTLS